METQIIKFEPDLPEKELEIYRQLTTTIIKDIEPENLYNTVVNAVSTAYSLAGYTFPDEKTAVFICKEMVNELKVCYKSLRVGEIMIAVRRGVLKAYGDYIGLSVVSLMYFVKMYSIHNDRFNAIRMLNTPPDEKYEPIQSEVFRQAKNNVLRSYQDYLEGKELYLASVPYDFLDSLGLINISNTKKKEIFERARLVLIKEHQKLKGEDSIKRSIIKQRIDELEKGEAVDMIKNKAKHLALEFFFECAETIELDIATEIGDFKE